MIELDPQTLTSAGFAVGIALLMAGVIIPLVSLIIKRVWKSLVNSWQWMLITYGATLCGTLFLGRWLCDSYTNYIPQIGFSLLITMIILGVILIGRFSKLEDVARDKKKAARAAKWEVELQEHIANSK